MASRKSPFQVKPSRFLLSLGVLLCIPGGKVTPPLGAEPTMLFLLRDFPDGWRNGWDEKHFTMRHVRFSVLEDDGNRALEIASLKSAGGLWRKHKVLGIRSGRISWRWRIASTLSENSRERKKGGDDYAARVFVIFEPRFPRFRTRAICYVWASSEPVLSLYPNPYGKSVGTLVVESGDSLAGRWVTEARDFVADYERYFNRKPEEISGFAVMVDTDDTHSQATAWFDDLLVEIEEESRP